MTYPLTYAAFMEGLSRGSLLGLRCASCGVYVFPPSALCPECRSAELKVVRLVRRGRITTFTVIRVAREGYLPPYVIAMAELEQGPWVMGTVLGIDPERATLDLIGRLVSVEGCEPPSDPYTGGNLAALAFRLDDDPISLGARRP